MMQADLDNRFSYHAPEPGQPEIYQSIRAQARQFAEFINALCPEGREKSLAVTHIEEAVFWSNAAIARSS